MKNWRKLILISLTLLLLVLFIRQINWRDFRAVLATINPLYPLLFASCTTTQFFIRAYRWGILLQPFKTGISLSRLYHCTVIGFMVTYLLPGRLGEIVRPVLLAEKEKIRKSQAIGTIVVERMIDLTVVLSIFLIAVRLSGLPHTGLAGRLRQAALLALPLVLLAFLFIYLVNSRRFLPRLERLVHGAARILPAQRRQYAGEAILSFIRSLNLDLRPLAFLRLCLLSLTLWLFIIPFYWLLMRGFPGMTMPFSHAAAYFGIIFVAAAIPTPGMAGSLDLASIIALTRLFAIPEATAAAYTITFHVIIVAVPVLLGFLAMWREGLQLTRLRQLGHQS